MDIERWYLVTYALVIGFLVGFNVTYGLILVGVAPHPAFSFGVAALLGVGAVLVRLFNILMAIERIGQAG